MPYGRIALLVLLLSLIAVLLCNVRALLEGLTYLHQWRTWRPQAVEQIARDGMYGLCYDLVALDNQGRYRLLEQEIGALGLTPVHIPLSTAPDAPPNLYIPLTGEGPYTLLVAHYDKSREAATYQGASDNTAAVVVLVAALRTLAAAPADTLARPMALLWTSGEEQGALGAHAFMEWSRSEGILFREVIVLDMLGRGRLASRAIADPGFRFWLPFYGHAAYDGRALYRSSPYRQPDAQLLERLKRLMGEELVLYRHFTAYGDGNVFQDAGLPTAMLSSDNMYYLDLVWERDADRIELLDEDNLDLARRLVLRCALEP